MEKWLSNSDGAQIKIMIGDIQIKIDLILLDPIFQHSIIPFSLI